MQQGPGEGVQQVPEEGVQQGPEEGVQQVVRHLLCTCMGTARARPRRCRTGTPSLRKQGKRLHSLLVGGWGAGVRVVVVGWYRWAEVVVVGR